MTFPDASTVNVAGTRAFVGGGLASEEDDRRAFELVEAPPAVLVAERVVAVELVEAPPAVVVFAARAEAVELTDVEAVATGVAAVFVEDDLEPPQHTRSRALAIAPKRGARGLTTSA